MFRKTRLQLDTAALKNNLQLLKRWNGDSFFCPMVKANAYGHGDVAVAKVVESQGATAVGVALYEEGLRLREAGIRMPILVFAPLDRAAASAALTHQLTPVVGRFEDLNALLSVAGKSAIKFHLKFNTGMNRLGFDVSELAKLKLVLAENPLLQVEGVCTHLTHGEEAYDAEGVTSQQLIRLKEMSAGFPGVRHAHKSASLVALAEHSRPKDPGMGSRPGISLYGLPQHGHLTGKGLRPALRWSSQLVRVHSLEKGDAVGYGARWVAKKKSYVGVVPVGYGDGYMRALSNRGEMLFREMRVPVVGSVCMDYTLIDLTDACRGEMPGLDEEIVILGTQGKGEVSAAFLAERAGTIAYETVTGIGRRNTREVV